MWYKCPFKKKEKKSSFWFLHSLRYLQYILSCCGKNISFYPIGEREKERSYSIAFISKNGGTFSLERQYLNFSRWTKWKMLRIAVSCEWTVMSLSTHHSFPQGRGNSQALNWHVSHVVPMTMSRRWVLISRGGNFTFFFHCHCSFVFLAERCTWRDRDGCLVR